MASETIPARLASAGVSFLGKQVRRRFPIFGRMGDIAIVGNAGLRLANRKGLIDDETAKKFGAQSSSGGQGLSVTEMALIAGAAMRLVSRKKSSRR